MELSQPISRRGTPAKQVVTDYHEMGDVCVTVLELLICGTTHSLEKMKHGCTRTTLTCLFGVYALFAFYYIIAFWVYLGTLAGDGPAIAPLGGPNVGLGIAITYQVLAIVWSIAHQEKRKEEEKARQEERIAGLLANVVESQADQVEPDAAAKIMQLKGLLDAGAITQAEFEEKKKQLIGRM